MVEAVALATGTPHGVARRLRGPLLTAAGVAAGTIALHLRDPHVAGSWGVCPFALLTGWDCPGCGTLRAVNLLGNGDVVGAASSNLLFTLAVSVVAVMWVLWVRRAVDPDRPRSRRPLPAAVHVTLFAGLLVVVLGFAVLRNLPAGAWLHS